MPSLKIKQSGDFVDILGGVIDGGGWVAPEVNLIIDDYELGGGQPTSQDVSALNGGYNETRSVDVTIPAGTTDAVFGIYMFNNNFFGVPTFSLDGVAQPTPNNEGAGWAGAFDYIDIPEGDHTISVFVPGNWGGSSGAFLTYTAVGVGVDDAGKLIELVADTGKTITVPANGSIAFPVGTVIQLQQVGPGGITVEAAGGVTLEGDILTTDQIGESLYLRKRATNTWLVSATMGDISAALAALVDSAPSTLDTLNELAAALGDDENFATTTATAIGLKADQADLDDVIDSLSILEHNTQSASYTLVLSDAGKVVEIDNGSANTLTVPANGSVAFPIGTVVTVRQVGAGQTTLTPDSGVTLQQREAKLKLAGQWGEASLVKRATNEWVVVGDVSA